MSQKKLVLPYSLVRQAAADLMLGSSYAVSTYFDDAVLARVERVLKNTLEAVFDNNMEIEFAEKQSP